jgi:hypothetical protein
MSEDTADDPNGKPTVDFLMPAITRSHANKATAEMETRSRGVECQIFSATRFSVLATS